MTKLLSLFVLILNTTAHANMYLGSCEFKSNAENNTVVIHQVLKKEEKILLFEFYNSNMQKITVQDHGDVDFELLNVWPWSEVEKQYLKYRNGRRGIGMMMWDKQSGEGHLRKYKRYYDAQKEQWVEREFYLNLTLCNIDLTSVDFIK